MLKLETLLATVLLKVKQEEKYRIEDLSREVKNLINYGIDASNVSMRNVPGGIYSEDIENFVGRLLLFGYAVQRSPIKLTDKGLDLCRKIIEEAKEENADEVDNLTRAIEAVA